MSDPMINVNKFRTWKATMDNQSIFEYLYAGNLNKSSIAKACGFSSEAFKLKNGNRQLIEEFNAYQNILRKDRVLPELTERGKKVASGKDSVLYDQNKKKDFKSTKRASELEIENTKLLAENARLKIELSQYKDLSETLSELGVIPK
ncbi:hypothetical protein JEU11_03640 [Paraglaciecola chathamensis]|uniref:Transposase n=1 Tax=Paraglaciecola chathamensis TaxID=368405 RepID=A0ABS0WAP4_9ALTE|nr:VPA1267 family protein [Paraglaciecola chathamensis]MBJ2135536.1 hypothetical protein [Paraglaciecola chathamensis]|tara:strand:+ start:7210 stop:7650 length:441 start_codon:yes stop_codon:yes gene_type:complete